MHKFPCLKTHKLFFVNMDAARAYLKGYLGCGFADVDIDGAASEIVDYMRDNRINLFCEIPTDIFKNILASHKLK